MKDKEEDDSISYSPTYCPMCTSPGRECRPQHNQPRKSPEPEQPSRKEPYYHSRFSSEEEDCDGPQTKPDVPTQQRNFKQRYLDSLSVPQTHTMCHSYWESKW